MSMTKHLWIERAAYLNNEAMSFVAVGERHLALKTFKSALAIMCAASSSSPTIEALRTQQQGQMCTATTPSIPFPPINTMQERPSRMRNNSIIAIPTSLNVKESGLFVYNRLILFHVDSTLSFAPKLIACYCSIVVYNIALTMHLMSEERGCAENFARMKKVLYLYGRTLSLVEEATHATNNSSNNACDAVCVLLKIAALNNSAQIFNDLCQFNKAWRTLDMLKMSLLLATLESSTTSISTVFNQQEIHGFVLNVMLLTTNTVAPAA